MRSKQVQILSGICGVQLIGYACRAAGFKTDIWIGFAGSVFLMLDIVYLAIQEKGRKKCPECDSEISKKVRICPECGYLFQQGLSEEIYDILYVSENEVQVTNNLFTRKMTDDCGHIVIVEKPGYIHEIRIPDVLGFCTVKEGGEIEYYRNADG